MSGVCNRKKCTYVSGSHIMSSEWFLKKLAQKKFYGSVKGLHKLKTFFTLFCKNCPC